jgi:hypothetical protein
MTYARRRLDITFTLTPTTSAASPNVTTNPTFAEGGNQITLTNHRATAQIKKAGGLSMTECQFRIYGMSLSLMNQLSTLGRLPLAGRNNAISVSAGDDDTGMGVVFQGTITNAWADFKASPEVPFHVVAQSGMAGALAIAPPSSFTGSASVATIMSGIAAQMGLSFENNGVTAQLANPYFPGTLYAQAQACAQAANIDLVIELGVLAISPKGQPRGGQVPLITPQTGMIGYPAFTGNGIAIQTLYNPSITFQGLIKVESELTPANGQWRVYSLMHDLAAEMPGGPWFTYLEAAEPQFAPIR